MEQQYIDRMKERLETMWRVALLAHDPQIVELGTAAANQLEQDISELEAAQSDILTVHLGQPPRAEK